MDSPLLIFQGHGEYTELYDEKEFFEATKKSENVVCHFYRDQFMRCKIVDKHLEILARKHIETKFCKINVEKAPFLTGIVHWLYHSVKQLLDTCNLICSLKYSF